MQICPLKIETKNPFFLIREKQNRATPGSNCSRNGLVMCGRQRWILGGQQRPWHHMTKVFPFGPIVFLIFSI